MPPPQPQKIDPRASWISMTEKLPPAVAQALSVKGATRSLVVNRAWVDASKGAIDLDDLQAAKGADSTLSVPLMADISLVENETGRVIDNAKKMRIGNVPAITPHGTFLVNGVEYNVDHQLRLDPSIYTVVKDNGNLVSAFNIGHGSRGKRIGLHYRPDAGVLDLTVGNSKTPLLPVLHALGVDDKKIAQSLGGEFAAQNAAALKDEGAETMSAAALLTGEKPLDPIRAQEMIRGYFQGTRLDRHATAMVHGFKGDPPEATFGTVSPELLLMQAAKHMKVYRGDAPPDDRNSLTFKTLHGMDDMLPNRFLHWKNRNLLASRIAPRLNSFDSVRKVIGASDVTPIIDKYFLSATEGGAGVVHVGEQNNPVQMHSDANRITMMGEGGISGGHSVPHSVRMVHPSQYGVIDPVNAPADGKVGVVMHPAHGLIRIGDKLGTELIDMKTGKKTPVRLDGYYNRTVALPDQFTLNDDGTFKPKGSTVRAMTSGKMKEVRPDEVDFIMPSSAAMLSHSFRMIPMMGGISGGRAMIGGKMIEQALPLVGAETQLVRARVDGGAPVEDPSSSGARVADIDGVVHAIEPSRIMIQAPDGKIIKHGIYDHFPSQSGALFHHTPIVKPGDVVKKGQVIADSAFSKSGVLAFGRNLVTAYLPPKGLGREDAQVISESAAKKLCFDHETEILTRRGWMTRAQLLSSDEIACLADGIVEYQRPIEIHDYFSTEMVVGRSVTFDICVTPEHGLFVAKQKGSAYSKRAAESLIGNERIKLLRSAGNSNEDREFFVVPASIWRGHERPLRNGGYNPDRVIQELRIAMDDWCLFFGLYISEGSCDDPEKRSSPRVQIVQKKKPVVDIIVDLQERMGIGWINRVDYLGSKSIRWLWGSKQACEYLRPLGKSLDKHLPEWVWALSQRQARILLRGLMLGDGHRYANGSERYLTSSRRLADDVQRLALHCGVSANVYVRPMPALPPKIRGRRINATGTQYAVAIIDNGNTPQVNSNDGTKLSLRRYDSAIPVWCVTTSSGVVYVRRGGKPRWCGNSSRHLDVKEFDLDEDSFASLNKFRAAYPGHITDDHAKRMDADGVVRVGETVSRDEPLILGLKRRMPSAEEAVLSRVSKKIYKPLVNSAVSWDQEDSGKVVRVEKLKNKVKVYVQYDAPARIGDKLSGFGMGSKGVISAIFPDSQMPMTRDGRRVEMFFNGIGMTGRVNPSMYHEAALGRVAEHDGKPYYVDSFTDQSYVDLAQSELDKRGIPDQMDLIDPETNRIIPKVGIGINHWMKLKHRVAGKYSARDTAGYDIDGQPLRGGEEGAKRTDPLQMYAILAHGAHHVLQDVAVNKSDRNDEMWRAIRTNQPLPPPKPSFASEKFLSMLLAAGINPVKSGDRITVMPLTDKEILAKSNGRVVNPGTMKMTKDEFVPEAGGLFDPAIVGGFKYGGKQSHLDLPEPFVSPVMESAVMSLTNLKREQFDGLTSGKLGLMPDGKITAYAEGMATGGNAIGALLDKIDPQKEFDETRAQLQTEKSRTTIDRLSKRGKYLRGLINFGMSPREAYLINHVPVIPPHYRPVVPLPNGQISWGGLNAMYRDLMLVSDKLKAFQALGPEHTSDLRASVYDALKAVQGLGDPLSNREYRGVLKTLGGVGTPKGGLIQKRLLGRPMDMVGRSTIIPDPELGIDEVGIPEDMAWRIYQPFIVREMNAIGIPPLRAADEIDRRTERAALALDRAMASRPALLNRAPSLHKFSVMAFNAKRVPGQAIQMQPLVFKGFNADVDGDSMIGSVIARIGSGDPKAVHMKDLLAVVKTGKPGYADTRKRVYSVRTWDPAKKIRVLAIVGGAGASWLEVLQFSEHLNLEMHRMFIDGIPAPVMVSSDASMSTVSLTSGMQQASTPFEAMGELCPVARSIDESSFFDSTWEGRFAELAELVSGCVDGARVVVPSFSVGEKIRFLGMSTGIEIRMFGDTEAERREILGFSMDLRAAEYVFDRAHPERLFCPQLKANERPCRLAALHARASGDLAALSKSDTKKHVSIFSYGNRVYIEPRSAPRSRGALRAVDLGRNHLIPFVAPLYVRLMKSLEPKRRHDAKKLWGPWLRRGGAEISDVSNEFGRVKGYPTALTLFSAIKLSQLMMKNKTALRSEFYETLYALLHANVSYERVYGIKSIRDAKMTAYDVSVPGGQVFCEASGLSLKNTMMVSVPISKEAVNEAATTMMPSKNLLNPGTHGIMVSPSKESVWGIWKMTQAGKKTGKSYPDMDSAMQDYLDGKLEATDIIKAGDVETTPGRIEVNSALPEKLRDYSSRFDNTKISSILTEIAKTDPKSYDEAVRKITSSGDDASYYMGMSFGLKDLKPQTQIRDRIMRDADSQYRAGPPTKERLLTVYGKAQKVLQNQLDAHYEKNPNAIWDTIKSGAMGKKNQAFQMIVAPIIVNDENGEPLPFPVGKSYSEGLGISDYVATMYGQRKGLIDKSISTAEPGEIHKETVTAAVRMQVDQDDCGALGAPYDLDDISIYHRLLGEDLHVRGRLLAKRGDPVTHDVVDAARSAGLKMLSVRTPLNCESQNGICAADAGLDEGGSKYKKGFNVGALAATTISEPLTQGVLSGFHHGNTAFSKTVSGLDRVRQLIELPKMVAGEGPLSSVDGVVDSVTKLPSGDFRIGVSGHNHFVPSGMLVQVKLGDQLTAGSPLSSGVQNPHEILRTRGVGAARKYISDELARVYKEGNNLNLDSRHFEVIARTLSDHAYVEDPGDAEILIRGDHMPLSRVEAYNKLLVAAKKKPIEFSPVLRGAVGAAVATDDWMARTNSRLISKKLQEAAGFGLSADVGKSGPFISRYLYGVNSSGENTTHPETPSDVKGLKLQDLEFNGPVAVAEREKQLPPVIAGA